MGIQVMPLTPKITNVGALAEYISEEEDPLAPGLDAKGDAIGRYLSASGDRVVARAHQVRGDAAAALGMGGQDITLEQFANFTGARHVTTGELLAQRRAAPVYKLDATGRPLKDNGQKIRELDAAGRPMTTTENQLLGVEIITEHPVDIRVLLVACEAAGATEAAQQLKAGLERINTEFLDYVQDHIPLVRRTIPASVPRARSEQAAAAPGEDGTVLTKPATKQQGSQTVYVPAKIAAIAVAQWTARETKESAQRPSGMPDPAPHTHNEIASIAWLPEVVDDPVFGTQEGRWAVIDEYHLLKRAEELSAIYDSMVHKLITDFGLETEVVTPFAEAPSARQRWTIKGISQDAREMFASNSAREPLVVAEWEAREGRRSTFHLLNTRSRRSAVKAPG